MSELNIERLQEYSEDDAEQLGRLYTFLSDKFTGEPVDEGLLKAIIDSPYHDQLIAKIDGRLVGAATLSVVLGAGAGRHGHLEDFVTDPTIRGQGVGTKIWHEVLSWCDERAIDLNFTSKPSREAAHKFYRSHGAEVRETLVFRVPARDGKKF